MADAGQLSPTSPHFKGFREEDVQVGKMNARLWRIEEENVKIREELRELVTAVRSLKREKDGRCSEVEIMEELREMKARESHRERENKELREQVEKIVDLNEKYREEIQELRKENEKLRKIISDKGVNVDKSTVQSEVKELVEREVKCWKEEREQVRVDMSEIIRKQQEENDKVITKKVVKIIKEKDNIVRDTVQKKMCVVIFGVKEKNIPNKVTREREELKRAKEILGKVMEESDEDRDIHIEEVTRIGKYTEERTRPMKVRLDSQVAAEMILRRTSYLRKAEGMKDIYIRREMNEEERNTVKELMEEAKAKNEERTKEQAEKFIWRVVDMKLRKWWLREARQENSQ